MKKAFIRLSNWYGRIRLRDAAVRHNNAKAQSVFDPSWMCPECGKLHEPQGNNFLIGNWYPGCCSSGPGYPLGDSIHPGMKPDNEAIGVLVKRRREASKFSGVRPPDPQKWEQA